MNIIYYCFAGAHASVVAAAIHCGYLPLDRIPAENEFLAVPYYDRTPPELIGRLYLMGTDEKGHRVYFMGMYNQRIAIREIIDSILKLANVPKRDYFLQDAFPLINFSTKFGGLISKKYSLTNVGRTLTIWGIQRRYPQFVAMVESVKNQLE